MREEDKPWCCTATIELGGYYRVVDQVYHITTFSTAMNGHIFHGAVLYDKAGNPLDNGIERPVSAWFLETWATRVKPPCP